MLYEAVALLLFANLVNHRDWWALCLPIGAALQGAGFFLRLPLANEPQSLPLYLPMDIFIVLAPACYFAFNYIWFGRLVQRLEQHVRLPRKRAHLTFLPPQKFGLVFIISDVTTFLVQAAGGGMQVKINLQSAGSTVFLIGIIAQFASYVFFLALAVPVVQFARRNDSVDGTLRVKLRALLLVLAFSSVWIIVRSVYRTIELAQGYDGSISTKECEWRAAVLPHCTDGSTAWFFGLDSAPLLLAIGVYIFYWPSSLVELQDAMQKRVRPPMRTVPWDMSHAQRYAWMTEKCELPLTNDPSPDELRTAFTQRA